MQNHHQSHHIFGFVQGERAQKLNNHIFVHASIAAVPDQADCEFREDLRKDEVARSNFTNSSTKKSRNLGDYGTFSFFTFSKYWEDLMYGTRLGSQRLPRRYSLGVSLKNFLNTLMKCLSDTYPVISAMACTVRLGLDFRRSAACVMRSLVRNLV